MPHQRTIPRVCARCGDPFLAEAYAVKIGKARYCSLSCAKGVPPEVWRSPAVRFWRYADQPGNGCRHWRGRIGTDGYGQFIMLGNPSRVVRAHRMAYELTYGPIPPGMLVCHHCDNPRCVRPDHLFLGTISDNALDMQRKGRGNPPPPRHTKLDATQVVAIRQSAAQGTSFKALALHYGVCRWTVSDVVRRRSWVHVA